MKNYIRSSIIVLIQTILPIIVLLIITPWLINSQTFNYLQDYLKANQPWFLIWHGQFLLGIFYFNEIFNVHKLIGFIFIWIAVIIYLKDLNQNK